MLWFTFVCICFALLSSIVGLLWCGLLIVVMVLLVFCCVACVFFVTLGCWRDRGVSVLGFGSCLVDYCNLVNSVVAYALHTFYFVLFALSFCWLVIMMILVFRCICFVAGNLLIACVVLFGVCLFGFTGCLCCMFTVVFFCIMLLGLFAGCC